MSLPTIAIFEDDQATRALMERALSDYRVLSYAMVQEGADMLELADLILASWEMPGTGGEALLDLVEQQGLQSPVIIVSALSSFDAQLSRVRSSGLPLLSKPLTAKTLRAEVHQALQNRQPFAIW